MKRRDRLVARTRQGYRVAFGWDTPHPRRFFAAPGSVNLMGGHVEGHGGYVLACAIDREIIVSIGPGEEGQSFIEAIAIDMGSARDRFSLEEPITTTGNNWQDLIRGAVVALQKRGHSLSCARLAIAGDVPIGAGLSSSSSFAVSVVLALTQFCEIPLSPKNLALVAHEAEREFLHAETGLTGQITSTASQGGHALLIDGRSHEYMPIPASKDLKLMIIDSGVRRETNDDALTTRRQDCDEAAKAIGLDLLRDATSETLEAHHSGMSTTAYRRARHVVNEIARVEPMAVALAHGDTTSLAKTMRASHVSLRDDYEASALEVDRLVEIVGAALEEGGSAKGGVRMTGAGFGGSVVAVVHQDSVEPVIAAVENIYNSEAQTPASVDVYAIAGGAREITPE